MTTGDRLADRLEASARKSVNKVLPADVGAYTAIRVRSFTFRTTLRPLTLSTLRTENDLTVPVRPSESGFTRTATPLGILVGDWPAFVASARQGGRELGQGTPGRRKVSLKTSISTPVKWKIEWME